MKFKLFTAVVALLFFVAGVTTHAQTQTENMYVYRDGRAIFIQAVAQIDSITFRAFSDDGFEIVPVAGGTTTLNGTNVTLNGFKIGKYEVTQKQWLEVMGSWPSTAPSSSYGAGDNYPMYNVSYTDIEAFLSKLNQLTGKNYRLPTEAEWEYAAKGGQSTHNYDYSGSNAIGAVAWFSDNSGSKAHEVGTKDANELGIYDMSGNVWEWCYDWYGDTFPSSATNPTGASSGSYRMYRGGGWGSAASDCGVSGRNATAPGSRSNSMGFRLALPL